MGAKERPGPSLLLFALLDAGCNSVPPAPAPELIEPTHVAFGTEVAVVIRGRDFRRELAARFDRNAVQVNDTFTARLGSTELRAVAYVDDQTLTAVVPASLGVGTYALTVLDPGGRAGVLENAFAVTPGPVSNIPCDGDGACTDPCYTEWICAHGWCAFGAVVKDSDGDGFFDSACPGGLDCADNDELQHPDQTWYADCDGDAAFRAAAIVSCSAPATACLDGLAPLGGWTHQDPGAAADCDDEPSGCGVQCSPGLDEIVCDAIDEDCDGLADEAPDADLDAYDVCDPAEPGDSDGRAADCNDANDAEHHPGQAWYPDCDGDGAFQATAVASCSPPLTACLDDVAPSGGWSPLDPGANADCDDEPSACGAQCAPGLDEILCDAIDQNCDGLADDAPDADLDTFDVCDAAAAGDTDAKASDCDDDEDTAYPGAPELCDGLDNDCDPASADGVSEATLGDACDGADADVCDEGELFCAGSLQCSDLTSDDCGPFFEVGVFTKSDALAPAVQVVAHGLGHEPKALILWTGIALTEGFNSGALIAIGLTDETLTSRSAGAGSADVLSPSLTGYWITNSALTLFDTDFSEAEVTAWDDASFTLSWTLNTANVEAIHYLIIAGSAVTSKVVGWTMPTAPGAVVVGGVGFKPEVVFHLHAGSETLTAPPYTDWGAAFGIGAMDADGGQWANAILSAGDVTPTDSQRGQQTDATVYAIGTDLGVTKEASLVSMDADGFTLDFTAANPSAGQIFSLALAGVRGRAACFAKSTQTAPLPVTQAVGGVAFPPSALWFTSVQGVALADPIAEARFALGAAAGSSVASVALYDADAVTPSSAMRIDRTDAVFTKVDRSTPLIDAEADLRSFDPTGFTLDWTLNDAVATEICVVALGAP